MLRLILFTLQIANSYRLISPSFRKLPNRVEATESSQVKDGEAKGDQLALLTLMTSSKITSRPISSSTIEETKVLMEEVSLIEITTKTSHSWQTLDRLHHKSKI